MVQISDQPRITGDVGGQPKQTYFTPDGRQIRSMPDMHEYTYKGEGGIRDANLDKGWLLQKPTELKLYCPNCDEWHDTKKEVEDCGIKRDSLIAKHTKEAKKELGDDKYEKMSAEIDELKKLVKQLLEKG